MSLFCMLDVSLAISGWFAFSRKHIDIACLIGHSSVLRRPLDSVGTTFVNISRLNSEMAVSLEKGKKEHTVQFHDHFDSEPLMAESQEDDQRSIHVPHDPTLTDWAIPAFFSYWYCCCSVGMCAAYYALRANYNHDKGNLPAARHHTSRAKKLTLLAIGLGIPLSIMVFVVMVIYLVTMKNMMEQISRATQGLTQHGS